MKKTRQPRPCEYCGSTFEPIPYHVRRGHGKYCTHLCYSKAITGRKLSKEHVAKLTKHFKTVKRTESWRKHIALSKTGAKSHFWRGGITEVSRIIRGSTKYKIWREKVLKKCGYRYGECGSREQLEADHIKPFDKYPELRFRVSNGRILCKPCHKKTPTYGNEYARCRQ